MIQIDKWFKCTSPYRYVNCDLWMNFYTSAFNLSPDLSGEGNDFKRKKNKNYFTILISSPFKFQVAKRHLDHIQKKHIVFSCAQSFYGSEIRFNVDNTNQTIWKFSWYFQNSSQIFVIKTIFKSNFSFIQIDERR